MDGLRLLAARVRLVLSRLVLIFAFLLEFHGRVRAAALHGVQASLLASDSLRKLRSSIHWVVWSRRQPWACVFAVLSLLDALTGCDPAFLCSLVPVPVPTQVSCSLTHGGWKNLPST